MQGLFNIRKSTSAICYISILKKSHFISVGSEKKFDKILVPIYNLKKKNVEVATEGNALNLRRGFTEREKRNLQEILSRMGIKLLSRTTAVQRSILVPSKKTRN